MRYNTIQEATNAWLADREHFAAIGVTLPSVQRYLSEDCRRDFNIAMDALPTLFTDPNSGFPALLTTSIDPEVTRILFTPNKAAEILGEKKAGSWLDQTRMFPVVEQTGEVSSYGDYNNNGRAGLNPTWPNRQAYLFQVIKEYGQLELERAGLAKLNWVSEIDQSAATVMSKFLNLTYFFGIGGLQAYGLLNDPSLSAALTPAPKAYGGTKWIVNNVVVATANEVYTDIQSLFSQLMSQTAGLVDASTKMLLAMSPQAEVALTATNSFNVNVHDLLKKNFPNLKVINAVQYGITSATNPQGVAAGNFVQLIASEIEGQNTGYAAFSEKMRAFPVITQLSSFQQKVAGGTWGTIIRMPIAISSMVGV